MGSRVSLRPGGTVFAPGALCPGSTSANPISSWGPLGAKLYDPATNTWSSTGSLTYGRSFPTATLLPSGKVCATSGLFWRTPGSTVGLLLSKTSAL
jgi:hypothetical protein